MSYRYRLFLALSFGLLSLPGLFHRSAYGVLQRRSAARGPTADESNPGVRQYGDT